MHTYTWSATRQRRDALLAEAAASRLAKLARPRRESTRARIAGWIVGFGYIVVDAGMRLGRGQNAARAGGARLHPVR